MPQAAKTYFGIIAQAAIFSKKELKFQAAF